MDRDIPVFNIKGTALGEKFKKQTAIEEALKMEREQATRVSPQEHLAIEIRRCEMALIDTLGHSRCWADVKACVAALQHIQMLGASMKGPIPDGPAMVYSSGQSQTARVQSFWTADVLKRIRQIGYEIKDAPLLADEINSKARALINICDKELEIVAAEQGPVAPVAK